MKTFFISKEFSAYGMKKLPDQAPGSHGYYAKRGTWRPGRPLPWVLKPGRLVTFVVSSNGGEELIIALTEWSSTYRW
jgi:hypothetical protein